MTGRRRISIKRAVSSAVALLALAVAAPAAAAPPAHDALAAAQPLDGRHGTIEGFNVDATKEPGEPDHAGVPGGGSVWYRWIAPATGQVAFKVMGEDDFDPLLAVYTGGEMTALTPVAANDDVRSFDKAAVVSFRAAAGTAYNVAIDGAGGARGKFDLWWAPAPANDNFADAAALAGRSGRLAGATVGATAEPEEDAHDGSVWFRWTAAATRLVKFDTRGSDYDTVLAVYRGETLGTLRRVTSNDDAPHLPCCASWVSFHAQAGQTYSLRLTGYDEDGRYVLRWSPVIRGTAGRDVLSGTAGSDEIHGLGGNDLIRGGGGDDVIVGGRGNDALAGGAGDDVLSGGIGNDRVTDLVGIDVLFGGLGNDTLSARDGRGRDLVAGDAGRDDCRADRGDHRSLCP